MCAWAMRARLANTEIYEIRSRPSAPRGYGAWATWLKCVRELQNGR